MLTTSNPTVSIVMATYNRSNVLRYAIESVRQQCHPDWELIVVGDQCTDNSEAVVKAFADPRIRFVNRQENAGEQSTPTNDGIGMARGRYLALLNHDDLWLPHHLERQLATLQARQADMCIALGLAINPPAPASLCGVTARDGLYLPTMSAPASLWLMERELADRVGPWRSAFQLRQAPSQDWLHRAHRLRARIVGSGSVSALLPQSGSQAGAYRERQETIHAGLVEALRQPGRVADLVAEASLVWHERRQQGQAGRLALEAVYSALVWILYRIGARPPWPSHWLRHGGKGALIRRLRQVRGLPAMPTSHPTKATHRDEA